MFDKLIPLGIIGGSIYLINELDENDSSSNKKIVSTEFCDRDVCKNTCNKINNFKLHIASLWHCLELFIQSTK